MFFCEELRRTDPFKHNSSHVPIITAQYLFLEGISWLKVFMNYSRPLVNCESFSDFRCFMHKILECRQRGRGCGILESFYSAVCLRTRVSLLLPDSSPSMLSVPVCLPAGLRGTCQFAMEPRGSDTRVGSQHVLHLHSCLLPFMLFIARQSVGRWRVRDRKCVMECVCFHGWVDQTILVIDTPSEDC